jgi:transcriptional regulator with XRE-family HTH domain
LREVRERAGLTEERLSFKAGLSRPHISQLKRNVKSPTDDTLLRVCDGLRASAANIVGRWLPQGSGSDTHRVAYNIARSIDYGPDGVRAEDAGFAGLRFQECPTA